VSRSLPTTLLEDRSGRLWIGREDGLELIERGEGGSLRSTLFRHDESSPEGLSGGSIGDLCEDAAGAVWIGTLNGLNRVDDYTPEFGVLRSHPGGPGRRDYDFVLPIIEDRDGGIWMGTLGDGIWALRSPDGQGTWSHFGGITGEGGTYGENVRSLLQDRTGRIWAGTDAGVSIVDPSAGRLSCFPLRKSGAQYRYWVEAICESRQGIIWLGANSLGLVGFDPRVDTPDSVHNARTIRLVGDTVHGGSEEFNAIIEDRSGALWAGTEFGLVRIDPATGAYSRYIHSARDSQSISHNSVWSILEDPSESTHVLWVGTSDGFNRFDVRTGSFRRYGVQEGFPNAFVYGILRDDRGRLWLSTNHGLTRFDDRRPEGRKFRNYDAGDGLPGDEFNRRSACRLRNGEFLFGGTRGVVRFDPLAMRENPDTPRVVITSFQKFGRPVRFDRDISEVGEIELRHDEDVFSFEFVALSFPQAFRNRYMYKMEGFDREWNLAGSRRYANYTHLDPGEYVFRVRGSNNDGVWNEAGASVTLIILPPYWQTWWFRSLAFLVLAGTAAAFYRYRVSKLRQAERLQRQFSEQLIASQEQERSRIAGELHDSLMQSLLVAKNRSLMGLRKSGDQPAVERELREIGEAMTNAVDEVRSIAHNLRPYQVDQLGLTRSIRSLVDELNETTQVRFVLEAENFDADLPGDQGILVYRIVQEATSNILKHSGAGKASITVTRSAGTISIAVTDDGRGFAMDGATRLGFGLRGIAERVRMLNGRLGIDSSPGKGTTLSFEIPRRTA
jgi:signal transduction histidine kinase/ligand-binding sensor domain-containing protein